MAEHAFCLETRNGFGAHGELAVFEVDGESRVQRLRVCDNFLIPVAEW